MKNTVTFHSEHASETIPFEKRNLATIDPTSVNYNGFKFWFRNNTWYSDKHEYMWSHFDIDSETITMYHFVGTLTESEQQQYDLLYELADTY